VDYSVTKASGLAIHLDAPQRLVYSKDGRVCAEPSPDALQAIATSQGLSLLTPSKVTLDLANALSTNAGSIGLRTQSITLMREIFYRICEAAYSGLLPDFEVTQMIRRSQDLTLGVLAIEQLTGTVKAQQVAISPNANADASGNLAATQETLVAARKNERSLKEAAKKADGDVTEQEKKIKDLKDQIIPPTPPTEEQQSELQREGNKLQSLKDEAEFASSNYSDAKIVTEKIQENLGRARLAASATASGKTSFSNDSGYTGISTATSEKISTAVHNIVKDIVNKNYAVEACMSFLLQDPGRPTGNMDLTSSSTALQQQLLDVSVQLDKALKKTGPEESSFEIEALARQKKSIENMIDEFDKQKMRGRSAVEKLCLVMLNNAAKQQSAPQQQGTQQQLPEKKDEGASDQPTNKLSTHSRVNRQNNSSP
jgi:hypothetical protein